MVRTTPNILVVEDDRETRALIAKYLRTNACNVATAADGREMVRAMTDHRVDLLILDVMLPGEDGLSLCRKVRAESQVPIIMLTARGEDVDRIVGLEMGADDYMPKPFNPRELLARINAVLRRQQAAQRVVSQAVAHADPHGPLLAIDRLRVHQAVARSRFVLAADRCADRLGQALPVLFDHQLQHMPAQARLGRQPQRSLDRRRLIRDLAAGIEQHGQVGRQFGKYAQAALQTCSLTSQCILLADVAHARHYPAHARIVQQRARKGDLLTKAFR